MLTHQGKSIKIILWVCRKTLKGDKQLNIVTGIFTQKTETFSGLKIYKKTIRN